MLRPITIHFLGSLARSVALLPCQTPPAVAKKCHSAASEQTVSRESTEENHRLARLGDNFMKTKKAERECRERGLSKDNR